jgi:hypothetical protein
LIRVGSQLHRKKGIFKVPREQKCTAAGILPPQEYLNSMQRQSRMENTQEELRNKDRAVEREEGKIAAHFNIISFTYCPVNVK